MICEDPVRRGLLYVGLENGIFVSFDDGESWLPLQNNLPHAPVSGIVVQEHFNDLVISTYGRGFWILDDITPLQQLMPDVLAAGAHLFPPRPAYRFRPITPMSTPYSDPTIGQNPEYGAAIDYYLKAVRLKPDATAATGAGDVKIQILDAKGEVVRTLNGSSEAGLNRVHWDLRYEPTREVWLRTSPMYAPHIVPGPDGRPAPGAGRLSILAPPGTYTVKLSVGGKEQTRPLVVRKDPHSGGTEADIEAQMRMLFELRGDLNDAADAVNRIEIARSQIEALVKLVEDDAIVKAGKELNQKLIDLEMNLVDLRLTGAGQDGVRFASKLIGKLNYLANGLASGDFKPTDQQVEVRKILADQLRAHLGALDGLLSKELAAFNELLRKRNVPNIVVGRR